MGATVDRSLAEGAAGRLSGCGIAGRAARLMIGGGSFEGEGNAQRILPVRRDRLRGGGGAARERRLPLLAVPALVGSLLGLDRRAARGACDQRRGPYPLVPILGQGPA